MAVRTCAARPPSRSLGPRPPPPPLKRLHHASDKPRPAAGAARGRRCGHNLCSAGRNTSPSLDSTTSILHHEHTEGRWVVFGGSISEGGDRSSRAFRVEEADACDPQHKAGCAPFTSCTRGPSFLYGISHSVFGLIQLKRMLRGGCVVYWGYMPGSGRRTKRGDACWAPCRWIRARRPSTRRTHTHTRTHTHAPTRRRAAACVCVCTPPFPCPAAQQRYRRCPSVAERRLRQQSRRLERASECRGSCQLLGRALLKGGAAPRALCLS